MSRTSIVRFRSDVPVGETLQARRRDCPSGGSFDGGHGSRARKLAGYTGPDQRRTGHASIAWGVSLVFLALCVNVAGLSLARFNDRRRQFALSTALGASRGRLVAQAFTQSVLIGVIGAAIGIVLAHQLIAGARAWLPQSFLELSLHPLLLDWDTLFVAIGLALVATVVSGLLPAIVATRLDAGSSLRLVERGGTETRSARLLSRTFVVVELALACALLVPTLLLVRSFLNLTAIDRGLDPDRLSIVQVNFDSTRAADPSSRATVQARATELIEALPGVEQVTWSVGVPTMESGPHSGYVRRVNASGVSGGRQLAIGMSVGSDFFDVYRIPLVAGRALRPDDDDRRIIIDERIAATFFLDGSPLGQSLAWGDERLEVVGVARSVQKQRPEYPPTLYWKYKPGELPYATFTLRCKADCPSEAVIRHALLPIESSLRAGTVERLADRFDRDLVAPRMSASVGDPVRRHCARDGRRRAVQHAELRRRPSAPRVRHPRGARRVVPGDWHDSSCDEASVTAMLGLGLGSLAAWFLVRALESIQFGVTVADPISWVGVIGISCGLDVRCGVAPHADRDARGSSGAVAGRVGRHVRRAMRRRSAAHTAALVTWRRSESIRFVPESFDQSHLVAGTAHDVDPNVVEARSVGRGIDERAPGAVGLVTEIVVRLGRRVDAAVDGNREDETLRAPDRCRAPGR